MAHNFVTGALAGLVVAGLGAGTVSVLMGPVVSPRPDVAAAVEPTAGTPPPAAEPDALPRAGLGDGASPQAPSPGIPEPDSGAEEAGEVADTRSTGRPETGAVPDLGPVPDSDGAGQVAAGSDAPVMPGQPGAQPERPEADELSISNNPAQPSSPAVEEAAPQLGPVEAEVAEAPMAPEAEAPVTAEGDPARTEAAPADSQVTPGAPAAAPEAAEGIAGLTPEAGDQPETPLASVTAPEAPQTANAPEAPTGEQTPPSPVVVPEEPPVVAMVDEARPAPEPASEPEPAPEPAVAPEPEPAPEPDPEPAPEPESEPAPEPAPVVVTEAPRVPETPVEPAPEVASEEPARPQVSSLIARDADQTGRPSIGTPAGTLTDRATAVTTNRLPTLAEEPDPKAAVLRPIEAYAARAEVEEDKPLMSIVLIDDGSTPLGLEALEAFPYPITFAVDTAWSGAAEAMRSYRAAGFEVMALADLPEGARAQDAEVTLSSALAAVPEAVAVLEGSAGGLQANREIAEQVAGILAESGHGLVLYPQGLNTGQALASRAGVPAATLFRDFDSKGQSATVIRRFLDQAAFKAGQEGAVIMLGRLRPETISALLIWGLQDRASRVAFVPVSQVLLPDGADS
ncbi:divergent polysaccharide deacetylase family protein [Marinovum sp.]|uniref:divergent polysaccharide deacetylase family protein n=1 Tax=Marinovum sp. TaxID=2024839 RepID=UPI003A8ED86C